MSGDESDDPSLEKAISERAADQWEERYERDRGIFTDTDRKYLWGIESYEDRAVARSNRRKAIRNRTENGLLDLFYLPMIEEDQQEKVFEQIEENAEPGALREAVTSFIEFLYIGVDGDTEWLEHAIGVGIVNGETSIEDRERYGWVTADVDIDLMEGYDIDRLERLLKEGQAHNLSPAEIGVLVRTERVGADDLEQLSE